MVRYICHICKYSVKENMVDVIVIGFKVGSHRISNEVRREDFSAFSVLFFDIMARIEYSFKLFLSIFNLQSARYELHSNVRNLGFENRGC